MKFSPQIILFATLIGLVSLIIGCSENPQKEEGQKVAVKLQKEEENSINLELVEKYNAVRDWDLVLTQSRKKTTKSYKESYGEFYTVTLQKALLETNGKPVLLNVVLDDIYIKNKKYFAEFSEFGESGYFATKITYFLECDEKLAQILLKVPKPSLYSFTETKVAVVAKIEDVKKGGYTYYRKYQDIGDDDSLPSTHIVAEFGDSYFVRGECVDVRILDKKFNELKAMAE